MYRIAYLFVTITGFTSLVYQITWHKYLAFYIGSHALVAVLVLPPWEDARFIPSVNLIERLPPTLKDPDVAYARMRARHELKFAWHGPSAHVAVVQAPDGPQLHLNGNPNTGHLDRTVRAMNAIYPLAFSRMPGEVFVIGLGGGLSTSIFAEFPTVERVAVSEIAIGAIHALPYFDEQNDEFTQQPFFDKAEFIPADAIQVLRSSDRKFDIIVSEPNHPWVAGVENLFTRELLSEIRSRLSPGGVYCQWLPLFDVPGETVQAILNTFSEVFPEVRVFSAAPGTLSILAGDSTLKTSRESLEQLTQLYSPRFEAENPFRNLEFLLTTELLTPAMVSLATRPFDTVLSFEFPSVAKQSFGARFAGIDTDISSTIGDLVHAVPARNTDRARFSTALAPDAVSIELFDNAYEVFNSRGSTWDYIVPRLWYERARLSDDLPDWPAPIFRNAWEYLTGLRDQPPERDDAAAPAPSPGEQQDEAIETSVSGVVPEAASERSTENDAGSLDYVSRLFREYRRLVSAGVPADASRMLSQMPRQCETTRCYGIRLAVLTSAYAYSPDIERINALNPADDADREEIDRMFAQIKAARGS